LTVPDQKSPVLYEARATDFIEGIIAFFEKREPSFPTLREDLT
jgi:hypothetical protein